MARPARNGSARAFLWAGVYGKKRVCYTKPVNDIRADFSAPRPRWAEQASPDGIDAPPEDAFVYISFPRTIFRPQNGGMGVCDPHIGF